jgi:hypothetical protein
MSAKPIRPGDYSPPPPELRHLFGSFAELRARIRNVDVPDERECEPPADGAPAPDSEN